VLTVKVSTIEPLGYKSSSFNAKIANGEIQTWNNNNDNNKLKNNRKNSSISKSHLE